ncbi:MAG: hypothetical protein GOU97_00140 [Nanoarchaeota archaeon]|nr:hypothetical protein [Nanoarchaeota archaeon]
MRGRPKGSIIRNRICQILHRKGFSYGYEIYNIYKNVFGQVSMKSIYYHLKQGVKTGEVQLVKVRKELGNYTWGDQTERTYYTLGPQAIRVSEKIPEMEKREMEFDWTKVMEKELKIIEKKIKRKMSDIEKQKILNKIDSLIHFCTFKKMSRDYLTLFKKAKNNLCDTHTP